VENAGNLNPQEMQVMLKMCGFRVEGKLVPELTNEEEVENSL